MTASETHRAIEAVWRIESAKLIAGLARIVRDVGLAEDLAQDALVAALEQWPASGVPDNPGAWLMATAKHRAIDAMRRDALHERKHAQIGAELEDERERAVPDLDAAIDDHVGDDLLSLMFTACHPVLSTDARVALTLRLLGGLTTDEIARAFLVPEPTIAQRIVRAKKTLAERQVPFEVPRGAEFHERLSSVLQVIYLVFNEGYSATAGDDWVRPALCEDALRLGRILAGLVPDDAEVHGLVALMEIQASRLRARTGPTGEPVLLLDQDRSRWDQLLIRRGLDALARAESLWRRARALHVAGGDRRVSRPSARRVGDRLAAHRDALLPAGRARSVADRRAESRGRRVHGFRAGGRTRDRRSIAEEPSLEGVPPASRGARRLLVEARPIVRGAATSSSARRGSRAMRVSGSYCSRARAVDVDGS